VAVAVVVEVVVEVRWSLIVDGGDEDAVVVMQFVVQEFSWWLEGNRWICLFL